MFGDFPVLFNDVEFWAVCGKIVETQCFAAFAAKHFDFLTPVPRGVIEKKHQSWMLSE